MEDPRIAEHLKARRAGCECPWRWTESDPEPVRLCWSFDWPCSLHPSDWFDSKTGKRGGESNGVSDGR